MINMMNDPLVEYMYFDHGGGVDDVKQILFDLRYLSSRYHFHV